MALELGRPGAARLPLVRLHSECLTGDVFGSQRCDCGPQLREAIERITERGGYVLYLRQEGRGIGLYAKLDAYALQDAGLDTYQANLALGHAEDERDYTPAAQMLLALGASRVALLTNNPDKVEQLRDLGRGDAKAWLAENFDSIGVESTLDIDQLSNGRPRTESGRWRAGRWSRRLWDCCPR